MCNKQNMLIFLQSLAVSLYILSVSSAEVKTQIKEAPIRHKVVFFTFSGLRWDAEDLQSMPAIRKMKSNGVAVKQKIDAFQSESLPSFMTMSTGKYPNEHGILANKMSNEKGEKFDVTTTAAQWWKDVEPIWTHNQRQNGSSALCYWPGHHLELFGHKPKHVCSVDTKKGDPFQLFTLNNEISSPVMSFKARLGKVKEWLQMNETDAPTFIGSYFEEPYNTMMKKGIYSNETRQILKKIDSIIQSMLDWLSHHKLDDKVNFIVAGESGVTELQTRKEIFLNDLIDAEELKTKYEIINNGPIMTIRPDDGSVGKRLLKMWKSNKELKIHMDVYSKEEIPDNFHFKLKSRNEPITLVAQEYWRIYKDRVVDSKKSMMGFDSKYKSSHALFIAQGPSFKEDEVVPAIGNVDVYGALCQSLGIPAGRHSGNQTTIQKLMRAPEKWYEEVVKKIVKKIYESPKNFVLAVVIAVVLFFGIVFLVITAVYKACGCCTNAQPLRVKVPNPRKLLNKQKKEGDEHLLSEKELSDSDLSSSDEFYFSNKHER